MSKLGKLSAGVSVDGGPQKSHYGPDDAVTGQVVLTYEPHTNLLMKKTDTPDLFGPLQIKLTVHGKVNIKARYERELSTHHCTDLLQKVLVVHDGPFKAQAGNTYSFPWSFRFPKTTRPISSTTWIPTPTASLPPSFGMHFHHFPNMVDVQVSYNLQLEVSVDGINVKTSVPREDCWPAIKYDLPRPPRIAATTFTERTRIQSDQVLSWKNQPPTDTLVDIPRLSLDIICTNHRQIYPGQLLTYRIEISRDERNSTAFSIHRTTLELLKVELLSTTTVNTSERMVGSSECIDSRTLQKFTSHRNLPAQFSEGNDNTIDVVLDYVTDVLTSFAHKDVSRSYKLRVEAQLKIANKLVQINRDCPVTVIPPPSDKAVTEPRDLAMSRLTVVDDLPPPAYDQVTAGSSRRNQGQDSARDKAAPPYKAL